MKPLVEALLNLSVSTSLFYAIDRILITTPVDEEEQKNVDGYLLEGFEK
ncbi:hypothetical protein QWZ08_11175 [Ferruginibacter paludis]|nr:hypothetical protein [Ferruginibacter paludis]MDN3656192.1 hypothetical protein [Ferruginibacter paludis]